MYIIRTNQRVSVEEIAHIEETVKKLRHMAQISHSVGCQEVTTCHPVMGQLLRDYLIATTHQLNCLLIATGVINSMYREIINNCGEEEQ